jgi:hypothetical protein
MFKFSATSGWSLENELRCFVIFKKLEVESFPRGRQSVLCRELENKTELSFNTINAKVGNFKSEAGVTGESHPSDATKYIIKHYGKMSLPEAEALIEGYLLFQKANASQAQNQRRDHRIFGSNGQREKASAEPVCLTTLNRG